MTPISHISTLPADGAARQAVDRAKTLAAVRPPAPTSPAWAHETSHVGDLSVLALALLR